MGSNDDRALPKAVPLLDNRPAREFRDEILETMNRLIDSEKFILGEAVKQLALAVPVYSEVEPADIKYICSLIDAFYAGRTGH